jgi:hypothetical protein
MPTISDEAPSSSNPAPQVSPVQTNFSSTQLLVLSQSSKDTLTFSSTATAGAGPSKPYVLATRPATIGPGVTAVLPWDQLETIANQLHAPKGFLDVDKVGGLTVLFTAGYIFWYMRGGALLASALSSLPAWQSYDPLPILEFADKKMGDGFAIDDDPELPSASPKSRGIIPRRRL